MSEAWKAGGCRAPGGRAAQFAGEFAAVRARSSRVVRASSRTLFARCVICCSRAVRALFVRCSRVVRTLFALVVRTFNFQIRVACCVRVRTRCLHAVRTLLVRCSCAVRALFVRCLCERELTRELRDAPVIARHTRCLPHAWPQSHSHSHRRLVQHGGAHKHHGQHRGRPWLASPGSGQAMWGCCFGIEGGGARAGWGHSISPCRAAAAAACRRRAPAKGRRAAGGRRCHAQPACFRFGVAGVSVLALRSKEAAPGRVGAIQFLHAKPLLLRAAGGHQQRAGELRGGNAAAFG